jgi:hypothetical protein
MHRPIAPARILYLLLAVLAVCPLSHAAETGMIWKSDFSSLSPGPVAGARPTTVIAEEGPLRFLSKQDSETEVLFGEASKAGAALIDYKSQVRFRFRDQCTMFIAVKDRGQGRDEAEYLWYYVGLDKNSVGISCHHLKDQESLKGDPRATASIKFKDAGFSSLNPGTWITFAVEVGDKILKVRVTQESGETGEWEFPVFSGSGGSRLVVRAPTDVSDFAIEQLPQPVMPKE